MTQSKVEITRVRRGERPKASQQNAVADNLRHTTVGSHVQFSPASAFTAFVKNNSGADIEFGGLLYLGDYAGRFEDKPFETRPNYLAEAMSWHDKIAQAVVAAQPIPDQAYGNVVLFGQCIVRSTSNADGSGGDGRYVMPNPADPTKVLIADGGIGRVLARVGENHVSILLGQTQPFFRYELTEDSNAPDTTAAELQNMDGTAIGNIDLSDELVVTDQDTDEYSGLCVMMGNKFYPSDGPCDG